MGAPAVSAQAQAMPCPVTRIWSSRSVTTSTLACSPDRHYRPVQGEHVARWGIGVEVSRVVARQPVFVALVRKEDGVETAQDVRGEKQGERGVEQGDERPDALETLILLQFLELAHELDGSDELHHFNELQASDKVG